MKLGIMQPYFLPYIGYWQLLNAVDTYVIYDDVAYIKQGWVNRNRMLVNGKDFLFSLPLIDASSFKNINQIDIMAANPKLLKTIEQAYAKAPYFKQVFPLVISIVNHADRNLAGYVTNSIGSVADYLQIRTKILVSSDIDKDNDLKGQEKVLHICEKLGATRYYNAVGGQELYSKEEFAWKNISLMFLKTNPITYKQFKNEFVPGLSILDVMMFNSVEEIQGLLNQYELL
jgi:hypothetical protein